MNTNDLIEALDEWDVDWRDHYGTIESAEANYLRAVEEERQRRAEDSEVPADWFAGGFCENH